MLTIILAQGFISIVFPTLIDHAGHEAEGEGRVNAVAATMAEAAHPAKGTINEFNEFNKFRSLMSLCCMRHPQSGMNY